MPETSTSKKQARVMHSLAMVEWRDTLEDAVKDWHDRLHEHLMPTPALAAVVELHTPSVVGGAKPLSCSADGCHTEDAAWYECSPADWPCATFKTVLTFHPFEALPAIPPEPQYEAFYQEPTVTVTTAHPAKVGGHLHFPGKTLTIPLSEAVSIRGALTTASREVVDKQNEQ